MTSGVKLVMRNEESLVLGQKRTDEAFFNLPSCSVDGDGDPRDFATALFRSLTGADGSISPVMRGKDGEFGTSVSYVANWDGKLKVPKDRELLWVEPMDVMCGPWGLFARDSFNRLGMINRPALDLDKLYKISKKAVSNGSEYANEAIDAVLDEFALLVDIGKTGAIDAILREADVGQLHADVLDSINSVIEDIAGLKEREAFTARATARIEEIDGPRRKIKLIDPERGVISHDVRGDARKYYKNKAKEFGEMLRNGTLAKNFPGLHRGGQQIKDGQPGVLPPRPTPEDRLKRSPATGDPMYPKLSRVTETISEKDLRDLEEGQTYRPGRMAGRAADVKEAQGETVRSFGDRVRDVFKGRDQEPGEEIKISAKDMEEFRAWKKSKQEDEEDELKKQEEDLLSQLAALREKRKR